MMNLPVSTIRRICDTVVAINVSPLMATKYKMNIVSIALRSYNFMFRSNTIPEREEADLLIEPYNLPDTATPSWRKPRKSSCRATMQPTNI